MLYADDETAIKQASEIFEQYKDNLESIPAPIRAIILANQIKHNENDALVQNYFDMYVNTLDFNFKRQLSGALAETKNEKQLSGALAETKNEKTLNKTLDALKNKDIVKPQDLAMSWYADYASTRWRHEFRQVRNLPSNDVQNKRTLGRVHRVLQATPIPPRNEARNRNGYDRDCW